MTRLRPVEDHVLVRPASPDEVTSGGIVIPGSAQERPTRGEVLAVGPGRCLETGERAPMATRPGHVVLFPRYGGVEVKVDGEDVILVRESQLLAVLEP